jgi:FHA domain/zinc-ribbon domain
MSPVDGSTTMAYLFCNSCGHRNPPGSMYCSACGHSLDNMSNQTVTLAKLDPLLESPLHDDDVQVHLNELAFGIGTLVVRSGVQAGDKFPLTGVLTRLGRAEDSDISLDDITVSRRHAEITKIGRTYVVRDLGSLNGTYVNHQIVEESTLHDGDDLQIGKFHLCFFEGPPGG